MVVNVSYKNGDFYNTYEDVQCIESYPKRHILFIKRFGGEDIEILDTDGFILEIEETPVVNITLNDIKRLMFSEMKVFIFGVDESNGNSTLHIYSGLFKDVPSNVMNLPVNWIYPSSTDTLDISVDILSLNEDLIIKKEGVEQYAENSSNNQKP